MILAAQCLYMTGGFISALC